MISASSIGLLPLSQPSCDPLLHVSLVEFLADRLRHTGPLSEVRVVRYSRHEAGLLGAIARHLSAPSACLGLRARRGRVPRERSDPRSLPPVRAAGWPQLIRQRIP